MVNNANFPFIPGQGGRLATDRYDFQSHIDGAGFRHTADQTDIVNPSLVYGGATNVEQALEDINTLATSITAAGAGFIVVPDGYDCWHAANGTINLDPTVPTLDTFLNPLFAQITAGTPLPAAYARLQHGGVVLIKAGTYMVLNTINVPPGITLLGEGFGTKIVNVSQLSIPRSAGVAPTPLAPFTISLATNASPIHITVSAPTNLTTGQTVIITGVAGNTAANNTATNPFWTITVINPTHFTLNSSTGNAPYTGGGSVYCTRPLFNILSDTNRTTGGYADDIAVSNSSHPFMFARQSNIMNMVVADNFVEPTVLGDVEYMIPQNFTNTTFTAPALITQQQGSNLALENVMGGGRVNFSAPRVVSSATSSFVNTSSPSLPSGAIFGTRLKVNNCIVDGFSIPFVFAGLGGSFDFFTLTNSSVQTYGYFNGDSSVNFDDNCMINTSDCNMVVSNNHLAGNSTQISSIITLSQLSSGGAPPFQGRSKWVFGSNNVVIERPNTGPNGSFMFFTVDPSLLATFNQYINVAGGPISVNHSMSPFTVDTISSQPPYDTALVLVDTTAGGVSVILPATAFDGFKVIVKDIGGLASTNPITIIVGGGQSIDGTASNLTYRTKYGALRLVSFSENWWTT